MSDKRDKLEEELSEAAQLAHEWKELLESKAWQRYTMFLEEQRNLRKEAVMLTPISSEHSAFAQEFYKGEAAGLGLALALPLTQYELADSQRKVLSKELENYDETEADVLSNGRELRRVQLPGEPELDPYGEG